MQQTYTPQQLIERRKKVFQASYLLRVIVACAWKDILIALRNRISTAISILIPLNFLILFLLFAIIGGQAPTAVVMNDNGNYAQQFLSAMQQAHSFNIQLCDATTAQNLLHDGRIVAIVTIPADFDAQLRTGQHATLSVVIDNLNSDFTNDIRRAVPLSITEFYAQAFPQQVVIQKLERDVHSNDTSYISYLTVGIVAVGLMIGGLLQAGSNTAREYETQTVKELLLAPANRWAIELGKILGALLLNALSALIVLAVAILIIGVYPSNWGEVIGVTLLILVLFVTIGTLLGTLLPKRAAIIPLSLGVSIPLFFLSGAFGPVSFIGSGATIVAQIFPLYYAMGACQYAFHGFVTTATTFTENILILIGYSVVALLLCVWTLQRQVIAH